MKKLFLYVLAAVIFVTSCSALSKSEIKEDVSIDYLDSSYVFIFKSKYVDIDGVKYQIDARDAMSFKNSDSDIKLLKENIPEPFLSVILNVWQSSLIVVSQNLKLKDITSETEVRENISINHLDDRSAVILKTKHVDIDNVDYVLGSQEELLFENSEEGRKSILEEVSAPFVSVVMAVWGDWPTVESPKKLIESEEIEKKKVALGEKISEVQEVQN